jgi:hypothetical protein
MSYFKKEGFGVGSQSLATHVYIMVPLKLTLLHTKMPLNATMYTTNKFKT